MGGADGGGLVVLRGESHDGMTRDYTPLRFRLPRHRHDHYRPDESGLLRRDSAGLYLYRS